MDKAFEIENCLPILFKKLEELKYCSSLWKSFKDNYIFKNYQTAFSEYHKIMMSFVYFTLWKIKYTCPKDFKNALIAFDKDVEKQISNATDPFIFHIINERKVFRLLKIIGCTDDKLGKYTKQVKKRNKTSHANGLILFDTKELTNKEILKIIKIINEIQEHLNPIIKKVYFSFLTEDQEYKKYSDQIKFSLIQKYYLSQKDIEYCLQCDISSFSQEEDFSSIKELHSSLENLYRQGELKCKITI